MASGPRVACIGDVTIDRFRGRLRSDRIGGNALNAACWIAHSGGQAWLYSAVADDHEGRQTRDFLDRSGVHLDGLVTLPGSTPFTELTVGADGDRTIECEDYGTVADYHPGQAPDLPDRPFDIAHIGYSPVAGRWRSVMAGRVAWLSQDCGVSAGESQLQVAFHSRGQDLASVRAEFAEIAPDRAPIQVATCGASGALAWSAGSEFYQPALAVDIVDTTGAGDAFMAGFLLAWYASPEDLQAALHAGVELAAQCCQRPGGTPLDSQI
ncbi:MAG: PfkB family carbohydrate kinase [Beutenbergiaceae bacterium]